MIIEAKTKLIRRLSKLHGQPFRVIHKSKRASYLIDKKTRLVIDVRAVEQTTKYLLFKLKITGSKYFIKYYFKRKSFRPSIKQLHKQLKQDIDYVLDQKFPVITFDINFWSLQGLYYAGESLAPCTFLTLKSYPYLRRAVKSRIEEIVGNCKELDQQILEKLVDEMRRYTYTYNISLYRLLQLLQFMHQKLDTDKLIVALPVNDSVFHIKVTLKDIFLRKILNEDILYNFLFYIHYLSVTDFIKASISKLIPTATIVRQSEALTSKTLPPFVKEMVDDGSKITCIFQDKYQTYFTSKHEVSAFSLMMYLRPSILNRPLILANHEGHCKDVSFIRHRLTSFITPIAAYKQEAIEKLSNKWYLNAKSLYDFVMSRL